MRFLGRLVQNAAAALTVGGTVLAIGIAVGAVGLAETPELVSPWDNGLVKVGFGIGLLALAWIAGIFLVGMRATLKTDRFLEQIGKAIAEGKAMRYGGGQGSDIVPWAHACRNLLEAGLGPGEGGAFVLDRGESSQEISRDPWNYLSFGLDRLVAILDRPYLRVRFDFDHNRDWIGQSSKEATSKASKHDRPRLLP